MAGRVGHHKTELIDDRHHMERDSDKYLLQRAGRPSSENQWVDNPSNAMVDNYKHRLEDLEDGEQDRDAHDVYCFRCDDGGRLLLCEGGCYLTFHRACLMDSGVEVNEDNEPFYCPFCQRKHHVCFQCKELGKDDKTVFKCIRDDCGKYYHADHHGGETNGDGTFECARHTCDVCKKSVGRFFENFQRCYNCPVVYHEDCLPDAVHPLDSGYLLCTKCEQIEELLGSSTTRNDDMISALYRIDPLPMDRIRSSLQRISPRARKRSFMATADLQYGEMSDNEAPRKKPRLTDAAPPADAGKPGKKKAVKKESSSGSGSSSKSSASGKERKKPVSKKKAVKKEKSESSSSSSSSSAVSGAARPVKKKGKRAASDDGEGPARKKAKRIADDASAKSGSSGKNDSVLERTVEEALNEEGMEHKDTMINKARVANEAARKLAWMQAMQSGAQPAPLIPLAPLVTASVPSPVVSAAASPIVTSKSVFPSAGGASKVVPGGPPNPDAKIKHQRKKPTAKVTLASVPQAAPAQLVREDAARLDVLDSIRIPKKKQDGDQPSPVVGSVGFGGAKPDDKSARREEPKGGFADRSYPPRPPPSTTERLRVEIPPRPGEPVTARPADARRFENERRPDAVQYPPMPTSGRRDDGPLSPASAYRAATDGRPPPSSQPNATTPTWDDRRGYDGRPRSPDRGRQDFRDTRYPPVPQPQAQRQDPRMDPRLDPRLEQRQDPRRAAAAMLPTTTTSTTVAPAPRPVLRRPLCVIVANITAELYPAMVFELFKHWTTSITPQGKENNLLTIAVEFENMEATEFVIRRYDKQKFGGNILSLRRESELSEPLNLKTDDLPMPLMTRDNKMLPFSSRGNAKVGKTPGEGTPTAVVLPSPVAGASAQMPAATTTTVTTPTAASVPSTIPPGMPTLAPPPAGMETNVWQRVSIQKKADEMESFKLFNANAKLVAGTFDTSWRPREILIRSRIALSELPSFTHIAVLSLTPSGKEDQVAFENYVKYLIQRGRPEIAPHELTLVLLIPAVSYPALKVPDATLFALIRVKA